MFSEPILHVDMDAFFVEVERLRRPELRGIPVVVGGSGSRSVVAAASYEARRHGIRSAMPSVEARRRCPSLLFVPPDHEEYGRVSARLFELLRGVTPLVEGLSVDEAFLDVSGLRLHDATPEGIGEGIRTAIRRELGLPASVGVAATKFVAKLASDAAKPDGLRLVRKEDTRAFLEGLPVGDLWGVGEATGAALARLGIETVADLRRVPDRMLEREVGSSLGMHLKRLARGDDPRPVVPDTSAKSVSAEETFEVDLRTVEEVRQAVRLHGERVARRARRSGVRGRTVSIKIRFVDFVTVSRSETLARPTDVSAEIVGVAARLVDAAFDGRPVRLVGVALTGLSDGAEPMQLTVDDDPRLRSLDAALDAVHDRFGPVGVHRGAHRRPGSAPAGRDTEASGLRPNGE